ncbi:hypothetical protein Pmar_PMAR023617 [Perkinsus marinus ATCC 50983]|uniref:Uncharacterized protein n=1 Tax=Perkinsus marinus (strain ATCC 50983 / TXsc) TaxID=423536 RepID=C5KCU7_PERM5|nr:hypothetical protein Pmar_PMAR023617 [Perkinsus marinus ATCC 50983]EER17696.1 hypothetical protein Pmar_PMAR023617 [Perkinsus marinus ATCC 50983]|eukprot:XP_002785900.1 hypothetical protein Pmar_PMAR023617 [Perkinsus marinus ATCC 50983]
MPRGEGLSGLFDKQVGPGSRGRWMNRSQLTRNLWRGQRKIHECFSGFTLAHIEGVMEDQIRTISRFGPPIILHCSQTALRADYVN